MNDLKRVGLVFSLQTICDGAYCFQTFSSMKIVSLWYYNNLFK